MASLSLRKQVFPPSKAVKYGMQCKLYFEVIAQKKKYPNIYSLSPGEHQITANCNSERGRGESRSAYSASRIVHKLKGVRAFTGEDFGCRRGWLYHTPVLLLPAPSLMFQDSMVPEEPNTLSQGAKNKPKFYCSNIMSSHMQAHGEKKRRKSLQCHLQDSQDSLFLPGEH